KSGTGTPAPNASSGAVLLAHPVWTPRAIEIPAEPPAYARRLVLICDAEAELYAELAARMPDSACIELRPAGETAAQRYQSLCVAVFETLKEIVADHARRTLVQVVLAGHGEQQLYSGLSG